MFEAVFDILSAWNALLYLMAGATVAGFGLLIVGFALYVRATERSYQAQILGVRTDVPGGQTYWPLIAYTDESGTRHEVVANTGSTAIAGHTPGAKVAIFAGSADPKSVMLKRDWWIFFIVGAVIAAVGSPFLAVGVSTLHWTRGTALVLVALAAYGGWKLYTVVPALIEARRKGFAETRKAFMERKQKEKHTVTVSNEELQAIVARQERNTTIARPIIVIIGAAIMIGAGFWFHETQSFLAGAIRADGVVLRNEESDASDNSPTYHAVVAFTDRSGSRIEFSDSVGSSPPIYATGDKVRVLYARDNAGKAVVDRGFWNWLVPLLVTAAGALLFLAGAWGYLAHRAQPKFTAT
jgi:hypothetical protein